MVKNGPIWMKLGAWARFCKLRSPAKSDFAFLDIDRLYLGMEAGNL